uniref:Formin-like protein n=1 Tax=Ananas comosus var. bracteatus TaxID=296719 RepID=A0A6V7Q7X8_ANACO|nr:unnamed protein product [Ananas comosus var. bracteatus]
MLTSSFLFLLSSSSSSFSSLSPLLLLLLLLLLLEEPSTNPSPPSPSLLLLPPNSPSSPHYLRLLPLQLPFPNPLSPPPSPPPPPPTITATTTPPLSSPPFSSPSSPSSPSPSPSPSSSTMASAPPPPPLLASNPPSRPPPPPRTSSPSRRSLAPPPPPPRSPPPRTSSSPRGPRPPCRQFDLPQGRRGGGGGGGGEMRVAELDPEHAALPVLPEPRALQPPIRVPENRNAAVADPPTPAAAAAAAAAGWVLGEPGEETRRHHLPALMPLRTVGLRNSAAAVFPAQPSQDLDAAARNERVPRPKLKPLHWDKVRASPDRVTVWDQLRSSSFHVNEEMIESLFVCNATNTDSKARTKKPGLLPLLNQEKRVLDPKKSQNIAILLRALNVTKEEVCEALLEAGNTDNLGTELLETLLKMAPSKEEEIKLKEYKDGSELKLAMLYIANFDSEVKYLKKSFNTLEAACEELRSSRLFMKLLEAVLKTGNRMNIGTNRGDAHAFKLDTLLKLVDIKGADGKTTVLHFVVQEIIKSEGSHLSTNLESELANVKKAASMDSNILSSYVSNLSKGIRRIVEVLKLNEESSSKNSHRKFHDAVNTFLNKAEEEIIKIQAQESVALSLVKEITEYFHGDSAKEESHPFRIFMVVRDFLAVLDLVCKEVEKINEHQIANSSRQSPVPVNPKFHALRSVNSDGVHHHHHDLS